MSSNYPPGVTGREPQIAGSPTEDFAARCGRKDVEIEVFGSAAAARIIEAETLALQGRIDSAREILRKIELSTITVTIPECPFDGDVDAWVQGYELRWICPVCGHEHVEDHGPDPDAAWDSRFDHDDD